MPYFFGEDEKIIDSIIELRDVMCDDKVSRYCIKNNIDWSDTAMAGSPVEVILQAKVLFKHLIENT